MAQLAAAAEEMICDHVLLAAMLSEVSSSLSLKKRFTVRLFQPQQGLRQQTLLAQFVLSNYVQCVL